jgi:hypothetical protein
MGLDIIRDFGLKTYKKTEIYTFFINFKGVLYSCVCPDPKFSAHSKVAFSAEISNEPHRSNFLLLLHVCP